jgi:carbonic anhydrase
MPSNDIDESRERLLAGVRRFQRDVYPKQKAAYQQAAKEGQKPHALFHHLRRLQNRPGIDHAIGTGRDFVSRNVGNLVPAYGEMLDSVSASLNMPSPA